MSRFSNTHRFTVVSLIGLIVSASAMAETPINETRPLDADAKVEVSNVRGLIEVTGSDRNDIRITGTIGEGAKGLIIEGDQRRLQVRVDYPDSRGWGGWWGRGEVGESTLRIELPTGVELDVESVSANINIDNVNGARLGIETVSGDVEVESAAQAVEIDAVSGDLTLKLNGSRSLDMETVSGDARISGSVQTSIKAETVSGDLGLLLSDSALGELNASTVSGDLELDIGLAASGRVSVECLSGDVELILPASASASLRVDSFSGEIRSEFGSVEKEERGPGSSLRTRLGSGEGEIRIESFSGDVRIRSR